MNMQTFSFLAPPVVFGIKSAENISEHINRMGAKHILVISDHGKKPDWWLNYVPGSVRLTSPWKPIPISNLNHPPKVCALVWNLPVSLAVIWW